MRIRSLDSGSAFEIELILQAEDYRRRRLPIMLTVLRIFCTHDGSLCDLMTDTLIWCSSSKDEFYTSVKYVDVMF